MKGKIRCDDCNQIVEHALKVFYSDDEEGWKFVCASCWKALYE